MSCFELCFFNVHAKYLPEGFRSQAGSIVIVKVSLAQGRCQNAHAHPLHKSNKRRFKDPLLKELCNQSKKCWRKWVDSDRPTQGSLYESMKDSKKQISTRICASCLPKWLYQLDPN